MLAPTSLTIISVTGSGVVSKEQPSPAADWSSEGDTATAQMILKTLLNEFFLFAYCMIECSRIWQTCMPCATLQSDASCTKHASHDIFVWRQAFLAPNKDWVRCVKAELEQQRRPIHLTKNPVARLHILASSCRGCTSICVSVWHNHARLWHCTGASRRGFCTDHQSSLRAMLTSIACLMLCGLRPGMC